MSPRAAWRLERLGFGPVYDYSAGKVDWIAAGWPTERAPGGERRALEVADRHPPTCAPTVRAGDLPHAGPRVIVVNELDVVLGRIDLAAAAAHPDATADDIMEPGPTTVRAHEPVELLLARMSDKHVNEMVVTTPEGVLLGVVRRDQTGACPA